MAIVFQDIVKRQVEITVFLQHRRAHKGTTSSIVSPKSKPHKITYEKEDQGILINHS